MEPKFNIPSPIQEVKLPAVKAEKLKIFVKRDDLIDSVISGNKWRKLKYNIEESKRLNKSCILTFGGAFSNHIAATAEATFRFGLKSIGIIRGEELNSCSNETLKKAKENGMKLVFVSREEYRRRNDTEYLKELESEFNFPFIIPEGGANNLGVLGCEELYNELETEFDYICVSAGTGTTAAGILRTLKEENLVVLPSLKGVFLKDEILKLSNTNKERHLRVISDYHFGGYAKTNEHLLQFMDVFKAINGFELDKIYTAKLFYGINDLISQNYFPKRSKILLIHTGGLQGN